MKEDLIMEIENLGGYIYEPKRWSIKHLEREIQSLNDWKAKNEVHKKC